MNLIYESVHHSQKMLELNKILKLGAKDFKWTFYLYDWNVA